MADDDVPAGRNRSGDDVTRATLDVIVDRAMTCAREPTAAADLAAIAIDDLMSADRELAQLRGYRDRLKRICDVVGRDYVVDRADDDIEEAMSLLKLAGTGSHGTIDELVRAVLLRAEEAEAERDAALAEVASMTTEMLDCRASWAIACESLSKAERERDDARAEAIEFRSNWAAAVAMVAELRSA